MVLSRNLQHDSIDSIAIFSTRRYQGVLPLGWSGCCWRQFTLWKPSSDFCDARLPTKADFWHTKNTPAGSLCPLTHQGQSGLLGLKVCWFCHQSFQKERMKKLQKLPFQYFTSLFPVQVLLDLFWILSLGPEGARRKDTRFSSQKVKSFASKMGINTQTDRICHSGDWTVWAINWANPRWLHFLHLSKIIKLFGPLHPPMTPGCVTALCGRRRLPYLWA